MSPKLNLQQQTHRRLNIFTRQWVLVAPHRTKRPWQGQVEKTVPEKRPRYDPNCYLCPGNQRTSGTVNPDYQDTFVFRNDFSSLLPEGAAESLNKQDLIIARSERGECRVMCFSPRHDLSLPQMDLSAIRKVVDTWVKETERLHNQPLTNCIVIFENKGQMMGCSNPHPHCQIWANELIPGEIALEVNSCENYFQQKHSCLLCDYLNLEREKSERIVCENETFIVLVPFWAIWPFEVMLVSKRHVKNLVELNLAERDDLADILKRMTTRFDNLFATSFPYSMGFHQAPCDGKDHAGWHFHAHFYPPLLRSATVKKFMVGFEMLGTPMRDISPEHSAERLRKLSEVHYLQPGE